MKLNVVALHYYIVLYFEFYAFYIKYFFVCAKEKIRNADAKRIFRYRHAAIIFVKQVIKLFRRNKSQLLYTDILCDYNYFIRLN